MNLRLRERSSHAMLLLEALAWLTAAWLVLDVLPGRLYRRLLSPATASTETRTAPDAAPSRLSPSGMDGVIWAVQRASRAVPFRSVCFHRGIATQKMLKRRGIASSLHYGVGKAGMDRSLKAHVWVSCNGQDVMGGAAKEPFQEIAQFPFAENSDWFRNRERFQ